MVRESDCSCPSPLAHGLTGLADQIFQRGLVENLNGISEKVLENFPAITILLDLIAERNEVVHGHGHATKHVNWGGGWRTIRDWKWKQNSPATPWQQAEELIASAPRETVPLI
jgi:hypothetical protein